MSRTSNYGFHNKSPISAINHQILNILPHEVYTRLRFELQNYSDDYLSLIAQSSHGLIARPVKPVYEAFQSTTQLTV